MRKKTGFTVRLAAALACLILTCSGCGMDDIRELLPPLNGNGNYTKEYSGSSENPDVLDTGEDLSDRDSADTGASEAETEFETGENTDDPSREIDGVTDLKVYDEGELAGAASAQAGKYAFNTLDDSDKQVYEQMYLAMMEMNSGVYLDCSDPDRMNVIFQLVMADHPEIFWADGYTYTRFTYGDVTEATGFSGNYTMDAAERGTRQSQIDDTVEGVIALAPEGDDYTKIKYVYEYIIKNTDYDMSASDNQNICSVFIGHRSVCQGYSKATQYLLDKLGIESVLVTGTANGSSSHAWNMVLSDGDYYFLDTTWGDPSFNADENTTGRTPEVMYDYLCVTTYEIERTHTPGDGLTLQYCSSLDDNYYVRNGAYFTAVDTDRLKSLFDDAYARGDQFVTVKCSEVYVYDQMRQYLLTGQHVFDYLRDGSGTVSYWENSDLYSVTFWL